MYTNGPLVVMQWIDKRTLTTFPTKYGNEMVLWERGARGEMLRKRKSECEEQSRAIATGEVKAGMSSKGNMIKR